MRTKYTRDTSPEKLAETQQRLRSVLPTEFPQWQALDAHKNGGQF